VRYAVVILIIAGLYVATGLLGLQLAHFQKNATLIWAPSGLALAVLILCGKGVWPGIFIGAAITNAAIDTPPLAIGGIAVGNTLEAVVGATLLERVARFDSAFARLRDVIGFLVYSALLSTTVSATIGVGVLHLVGAVDPESFGRVWLIWWLGDAGGATVVAPLLLVGIGGRPAWAAIGRRGETWAALALLAALLTLAFAIVPPGSMPALLSALLVFPVVVWIGLRLGPRGAIVGSFLTGSVAVVGTARGLGPFVDGGANSSLYLVWAYMSTMGAVGMILAAAVAEREDADLSRRRSEEEQARLSAQVQHVQRLESLGLLAGGVAHDFNNLLVAIRGNAELLKLDPELDAGERDTMLEEIDLASIQAADLCRQLLIYAGRNRPAKQRLGLAAIIEEMKPLLRTSTPCTVELHFVGDDTPEIEGDRTQIGQVLMNLVINAAESIGVEGGVCVSWYCRDVDECYLRETFLHSDAPAGRYAVLEVSDSGSGMSPETTERIFDPFFTTKRTGQGLGMASVLGIVQAHGGAIKVQSRLGEGSSFEVLFPIAPELGASASAGEDEARPHRRGVGGTVLVADDEKRVRRVTRRLLTKAGFEVLEARDGAEAVELFRAKRDDIDAVLLDVSMPRLSGTDALAQIHELCPEMPAVLMSGYDEGRVDPSSDTPFVQKPFDVQVLLDTIVDAMLREPE
jgi:signal transduction histidine kinase/CheY-like chemotaxis protein